MGRVSQRKSSFGRIHQCTPQLSTGSLFRYLHFRFSSTVLVDPNLKNPWGLTRSSTTPAQPGSPWWVANNNSGTSTLYDGNGNPFPPPSKGGPLVVTVPPPNGSAAGTQSTPTGIVFNGSPTDFLVAPGKSAHFIFATEDGTIAGWNGGQNAVLVVDNSDNGSANGAVYKGATSGEINGNKFLYVTNFRSARVEVYDTNFKPVHLGEDAFDPDGDGDHGRDDRGGERIPRGFAPFNIQNIGGTLSSPATVSVSSKSSRLPASTSVIFSMVPG